MSTKEKKTISVPRRIPLEQWGWADVIFEVPEKIFSNADKLREYWVNAETQCEAIRSAHTEVMNARQEAERLIREQQNEAREEEKKAAIAERIPKFIEDNADKIAAYRKEKDLDEELVPDEAVAKILIKDAEKTKAPASGKKSSKKTERPILKIIDLTENDEKFRIQAEIVSIEDAKPFTRKSDGVESQRGAFYFDDGTASIKMMLWGKDADLIKKFSKNDEVIVTPFRIKDGYQGGQELDFGKWGKIEKV